MNPLQEKLNEAVKKTTVLLYFGSFDHEHEVEEVVKELVNLTLEEARGVVAKYKYNDPKSDKEIRRILEALDKMKL